MNTYSVDARDEEIEDLQERVEELEEKLRHLERRDARSQVPHNPYPQWVPPYPTRPFRKYWY